MRITVVAIILTAMMLAGCSATIGNKQPVQMNSFYSEPGPTHTKSMMPTSVKENAVPDTTTSSEHQNIRPHVDTRPPCTILGWNRPTCSP